MAWCEARCVNSKPFVTNVLKTGIRSKLHLQSSNRLLATTTTGDRVTYVSNGRSMNFSVSVFVIKWLPPSISPQL